MSEEEEEMLQSASSAIGVFTGQFEALDLLFHALDGRPVATETIRVVWKSAGASHQPLYWRHSSGARFTVFGVRPVDA